MLLFSDGRTDVPLIGRVWEMVPSFQYYDINPSIFAWGNIVHVESDFLKDCPLNPDHKLDFVLKNIRAEIFGTDYNPAGIVKITNHGFDLFTPAFAESYQSAGLTGLNFDYSVDATEHISGRRTKLGRWEIKANCGINFRAVQNGTTTFCTTCMKTPVLCPSCGKLNLFCKNCNKPLVRKYSKDEAGVFVFEGNPEKPIVEEASWKGEDFFKLLGEDEVTLCSDPARKWLEKQAPGYLEFREAILNCKN